MIDHLSRLEEEAMLKDEVESNDAFPDEQIFAASQDFIPWFVDYDDFLVSDVMPGI